ncbi:MAG: CU044_2847 family protein [Candidatus Accumulibacter sp. UW25]|jgi:hypothetical protein
MARTLQQIEIDQQLIWVEVTDIDLAPRRMADSSGDEFSNTSNVSEALKKVDLAATLAAVIGPVKVALEEFRPDEVNLELALGFKGGIGVFVASGEANAQIKVSVKWKPQSAPAAVAAQAPLTTAP